MGIPLGHTTGCHCGKCNQCNVTWADMSDRERDWWLAEKMGWTLMQTHQGAWQLRRPDGRVIALTATKAAAWNAVCYYTTDLTAAMSLLEQMRKRGEGHAVLVGMHAEWETESRRYSVCIFSGAFSPQWRTSGDDLPAVIAECVYRALGGD